MSHHHGVGKMTAAWVEESIGQTNFEIFKALKTLRPEQYNESGGTLGLDMTEDQKRKPKYAGKTWEE
ncbi:FAD-linked oxidase C-terminal domain-containing protein [Treponema denticola]|uniref:FAD-linked oxidase C-terminal domain-containing protein n=1 Tax=Treponema denticola TaxID=158 RepID=UPI00210818A3|nr:FAD-linked oxidase C-terminal domain-containing protein [Treponema denticola]